MCIPRPDTPPPSGLPRVTFRGGRGFAIQTWAVAWWYECLWILTRSIESFKRSASNSCLVPSIGQHYSVLSSSSKPGAETIALYRPGARLHNCIKELKTIGKAAEKLVLLLNVNSDAVNIIVKLLGERPRAENSLLIGGVKAIVDTMEHKAWSKHGNPTHAEWLAGVELPCIFEEHFKRPAGKSRNNDKPAGPCVRFIETSMTEMGMKYSGESIMRAMTKYRLLRPLRRDIRRTLDKSI